MKTYQDLKAAKDKGAFVEEVIREHKASYPYRVAIDAELYDRHRNVTISKYQKLLYTLSGKAVPDNFTANHKIASNFFNRFVTQENQYLLGNGLTLSDSSNKDKLGKNFDVMLQKLGRKALVGGVAFGFWDYDRLEPFALTEFVPIYDEENGALMAGIRFWQISTDKPLRATLYEIDGYTEYIQRRNEKIKVMQDKKSYKTRILSAPVLPTEIYDGGNYPMFPIVPLYANDYKQSELVGIRESIDSYDLIKSGFANDLDDASMIYWTLENTGGMDDIDLAKFIERMKTVKAAVVEGDDGAKAEAHTIDVPYASRIAYLERLEKDMYADFMALDVSIISSSSKTATEINAAYEPMERKVDQYEYCVTEFLYKLFEIVGIDDTPSFTRQKIANQTEQTQMVLMAAQYLDDETILNKLPWLTPEEVQEILDRRDEMEQKRITDAPDEQEEPDTTDDQANDAKNTASGEKTENNTLQN